MEKRPVFSTFQQTVAEMSEVLKRYFALEKSAPT